MVAATRAGQTVVRLKGGDPAIFGRLAEEVQALAEKIYATPAAIIEQAKQAVTYKAP